MANQIPEEVLKGMEIDASDYAAKQVWFKDGKPITKEHEFCSYVSKESYLQGRQDEWERQREEVDRLKELVRLAFNAGYDFNTIGSKADDFSTFKTKHNLQ